jgi:hypothetical protein
VTLQCYTHSVSEDRMAVAGAMMTAIFSHAAASLALVADAGAHICGGTRDPDCTFRRQHVCRDHQASSWMVDQPETSGRWRQTRLSTRRPGRGHD